MLAQLYASLHTGTPGDLAFYRSVCGDAKRVLELGCGYGRVMIDLLEACESVVGVDLDQGLIDLARSQIARLSPKLRARATVERMDMRTFDLHERFGRFDRVLLPHSGLYCLLNDDDVVRCFARARAHLAPGGRFILDAYAADGFHNEIDPDEQEVGDTPISLGAIAADGEEFDVYEQSAWDHHAQRLNATYLHVPHADRENLSYTIEQRYLLRTQIEALLDQTGFNVESCSGGFEGQAYDDDSELIAVVATPRD